MEQSFFDSTLLALWAVAVGAFLCAVYDLFRVFRLRKRQNSVLLFFSDVAFSLVCAVSMLVLFFNLSYGKMRLYAFACVLLGFLAWRFTLSRLYIMIIKAVIAFAERFFSAVLRKISVLFFAISRRISTFFYCNSVSRGFRKGFYFKKRKEFKNVTEKNCTDEFGY